MQRNKNEKKQFSGCRTVGFEKHTLEQVLFYDSMKELHKAMCSFEQEADLPTLLTQSSGSILHFSHPAAVAVGDWFTCVQLPNSLIQVRF